MDDILKICFDDYRTGDCGQFEIVREDGNISIDDIKKWIEPNWSLPRVDEMFLNSIEEGSILDVGCGSGVHMRYLQRKRKNVYGFDISNWAVEQARKMGTQNVSVASWSDFSTIRKFDNIICMNATIGCIGNVNSISSFFEKMLALLNCDGNIYIQGVDWRIDPFQKHANYIEKNKRNNIYPGQARLRLHYKDMWGDFFDWVWIDTDTLINEASRFNLSLVSLERFGAKYNIVFKKTAERNYIDLEENEWIIGDEHQEGRTLRNLKEDACGVLSPKNVRVEQAGPFRVSFISNDDAKCRMSYDDILKLVLPLAQIIEYPIYIGGSNSPLSLKLPNAYSDIDIYVVTPSLSYDEAISVNEKIQRLRMEQNYSTVSIGLVQEDWLFLPCFYEAVPIIEKKWWDLSFEESNTIALERLKKSETYVQSLDKKEIVSWINAVYGLKYMETDILRIIMTPRWKSVNDCHWKRGIHC